jgi:hypothetical protein
MFDKLICNQYAELKVRNKGDSARTNGVVLITVMIILLLTSVFAIVIKFINKTHIIQLPNTGKLSGKLVGGIIALLLFIIIYPIVQSIYGNTDRFKEITAKFDNCKLDEQQQISKEGFVWFIGTIVISVISILIL